MFLERISKTTTSLLDLKYIAATYCCELISIKMIVNGWIFICKF